MSLKKLVLAGATVHQGVTMRRRHGKVVELQHGTGAEGVGEG